MFVSNAARGSSMVGFWVNHTMLFIVSTLMTVITLLSLGGCERKLGKLKSYEVREMGAFRFLVTRSDVPYYGKELSKTYWCSTAATRKNRPTGIGVDTSEPQIFKGEGYIIFAGHGDTEGSGDEKKNFLDIHVVDEQIAYSTTRLTVTFDACLTRTLLNIPGTRFEATMRNTPIRYPDTIFDFGAPFFTKLTPHVGGGCFTINPERVDVPTTYFYCTSDKGKTWSLETSLNRLSAHDHKHTKKRSS